MGGGPVWEEGILVDLIPLVTIWAWDLMGLEFSFVQMSKLVAILKNGQKWPITINFGNNLLRNTVSELYSNVPLFPKTPL